MSSEQTQTLSDDTRTSFGYDTFEDCEGQVVRSAGDTGDRLGYGFRVIGTEVFVTLSVDEIQQMIEAIEAVTDEPWWAIRRIRG